MTDKKLKKEAEDIVYGMGYDTYESYGHSDFAVQDILVKFAKSKEKQIADLKKENTELKEKLNEQKQYTEFKCFEAVQTIEQLQKINNEQKETLKKVRIALIQERTANIINYGKGGVEMFDSIFEVLKGVSN